MIIQVALYISIYTWEKNNITAAFVYLIQMIIDKSFVFCMCIHSRHAMTISIGQTLFSTMFESEDKKKCNLHYRYRRVQLNDVDLYHWSILLS
jgi:hypothetical protein